MIVCKTEGSSISSQPQYAPRLAPTTGSHASTCHLAVLHQRRLGDGRGHHQEPRGRANFRFWQILLQKSGETAKTSIQAIRGPTRRRGNVTHQKLSLCRSPALRPAPRGRRNQATWPPHRPPACGSGLLVFACNISFAEDVGTFAPMNRYTLPFSSQASSQWNVKRPKTNRRSARWLRPGCGRARAATPQQCSRS
jgi:hypothetical protein